MKRIPALCLSLFLGLPAASLANGISNGRDLYLPWVESAAGIHSLLLKAQRGERRAIEYLEAEPRLREHSPPAAEVVGAEGGGLWIPRVHRNGRVRGMLFYPSGEEGRWVPAASSPAPPQAGRGELVQAVRIAKVSYWDILSMLTKEGWLRVQQRSIWGGSDVEIYRITYRTEDLNGNLIDASGVLALPEDPDGRLPLVSYQHGTQLDPEQAPSFNEKSDGYLVALAFGYYGYMAVAPDYLGLGVNAGLHPFVHAKSLATATVDLLRAARVWASQQEIGLNGQVFLTGYSEGGHATMATHREIEFFHRDEFNLAAVAPMAGPYSLSEVMLPAFASNLHPVPDYLALTLVSLDLAYGLFDDYREPFTDEFAAQLEQALAGGDLPSVEGDVINPAMRERLLAARRDDPVIMAMAENDVFRWVPQAPTRLYHCTADEIVPYANAERAYGYFQTAGATDVRLIPLNYGGHAECALPALYKTINWFEALTN